MTESTDTVAQGGDSGDKQQQHVFYDGHLSSASDEDGRAVEVEFEDLSPYRRKSSLVEQDQDGRGRRIPRLVQRSKKTQCLIHQCLERHRRDHDLHYIHDDTPHDEGPERLIEPKGKSGSRLSFMQIEPADSAENTDAGQVDQKSWRTALRRTKSQLDMEMHPDDTANFHSRLLTKKQLSEMAWGVRELSRRLGNLRLKFKATSIFILTKIYDQELIPKTREVAKWLLSPDRDVRCTVWLEDKLKDNQKFDVDGLLEELRQEYMDAGQLGSDAPKDALFWRIRFWNEKVCRVWPHTFDFVMTLGGDGTVLYASWLFQRIVPPVLSFALGSLGFLTKFDFAEYQDTLTTAFKQGVTVSLRLRFEGTVMRSQRAKKLSLQDGANVDEEEAQRSRDLVEELIGEERDDEHTHKPDGTYEILNEIVVDRGPNPTMSYTEIFGDDEHFTSVLADGVCVSTPTGSTAYNLAAGGSLCHPENPVMLVTSICPHTLSFRPIILPDTIVLRIGVPYDARTNSWASFDGRERVELYPGDYVTISASRFPFASVMPQGRRSEDWVNSISGKLGWNTRQKQKNNGFKQWDS